MSYIGNSASQQAFTPAVDYFNGTGSQTAFTLSRPVASVVQIQAVIENVPQNPGVAFTVSGNTITFTSAPPSGTNNIYVYYTSPITQVIAPSPGTVFPSSLSIGGLYWDTAGNVGIGNATPSYKLDVNGQGAIRPTSGDSQMSVISAGANYATYQIANSTNRYSMQIRTDVSNAWVLRDETAGANRVVVDTSGNLLVGTTNPAAAGAGTVINYASGGGTYLDIGHPSAAGNGYGYVRFVWNGNIIGQISQNGTTAVTYATSSDYRLKENIAPMTGALATVAQLKPVTYNWKTDGSNGEGFIAHELAEVCPDAVSGEKDAVDAEGKPVYQGIDTSFLVATLTAAIQEQQAIIEDLKARIETMEVK